MNPSGYSYEIKSIQTEIKRLNNHIKSLREQKKISEEHLYKYMKNRGIQEFDGFKIDNIKPKPKKKRKTKKQKKMEYIMCFEEEGIHDPEGLWNKLEKNTADDNNQIKNKTVKKQKDEIDPLLGF